jgi:DNA repair protein RadA/Sms
MKPAKSVYVCQSCGSQSPKWVGKCDDCGAWNTFVEEKTGQAVEPRGAARALGGGGAQLYQDVDTVVLSASPRGSASSIASSAVALCPGSLVLLGGEPGIGKSTLLLQAAAHFAANVGPVLYCSGEESEHQIKLRGQRLGVGRAPLYLLAETCVERLIDEIDRIKPSLLIVDSIQTVFSLKLQSAPGSVGQVRQAATDLLFTGKGPQPADDSRGTCDEGRQPGRPQGAGACGRHGAVLRGPAASLASRGSRGEEPLWRRERARRVRDDRCRPEAGDESLQLFLAERPTNVPGSAVLCTIEGSRRSSSRCRPSSVPRRSAIPGERRADWIRIGCRSCSPCWTSAPDSTCRQTMYS